MGAQLPVISTPGIMAVLSGLLFSFGFLSDYIRRAQLGAGIALCGIRTGFRSGWRHHICNAWERRWDSTWGCASTASPSEARTCTRAQQVWGSVACWVLLWWVVLSLLFSRLDYGKDRQHRAANGR